VAGLDDVERALAGAVRAAAAQRRTTGHEREAILRRAGDIADTRVDELAAIISAETGKAISEARAEAGRAGDLLRLSGFEGTQLYGDTLPLDAGAGAGLNRLGFTLRQPCGVVVAITPFNLSAAAGPAQDRSGTRGRQRGRAQARSPDAADRAEAGRDPARGRSRARRDLVRDRSRWRARHRPGQRPTRAQDQLHRQHRDRRRPSRASPA